MQMRLAEAFTQARTPAGQPPRRRRYGVLAVALLVIGFAVRAQVAERLTVNLVEVPVNVIDRDGNPVRGLTAANFELTDEGKKQTVTAFDSIDFAAKESVSAISPLNPNARRSFMLLFDLGYSSPKSLLRARDAARTFVEKNVKPRDVVAVATLDRDRGFHLVTSFTPDRQLIAAAIDQPALFKSSDPLQIANASLEKILDESRPLDLPGDVTKSSDDNGAKAARADARLNFSEAARDINRAAVRQSEEYLRGKVQKQIETLSNLASMLSVIPGRKHVVLLSEGFDAKYVTGRDVHQGTSKENDDVLHGDAWKVDSDARFGTSAATKVLDDMAKLFRGSDVVLDAIDIQGVRVDNDIRTAGARTENDIPTSSRSVNNSDGLSVLALPTGGMVFRNSNDLGTNFDRLMRGQNVVYVLGFQASSSKPGKFHSLNVRLVNAPPGARASFRSGYYETGNESVAQRALTNAEIVVSDIPQNGIAMRAMSGAFPGSGANAQVPVIVEMNGADLLAESNGGYPAFEIFIYAFDADGFVRDRLVQQLTLDAGKVGEKLKNRGLKYFGTLSLPPGTYAVKSLVKIANSDRRGFARIDVVVPKEGEIALAPFFIDDAPSEWVLVRGASHDRAAQYPFTLGGRIVVPGATGRDAGGATRKLALILRNANLDEVVVETMPKTTVIEKAAGDTAADFVFQLDGTPADPNMQVLIKKGTATTASAVLSIQ